METVEQPKVYAARDGVGVQAALCLAGGIGLLLVMVAIFVFSIALPKNGGDDKFLPGMIGGTSIVWIGLIGRGIFLLRSVTRVTLDSAGVHLQGFISHRSVRWDEIDHIEVDKKQSLMGATHRVLTLTDAGGKKIAQIPETIADFEDLGNEIAERSTAARGHSTYDTAADEARQSKKQLRKMRLLSVLAAILALGMGAGFVAGLNERLHERRYETEGVDIDANLVRRYKLRVTPYVEYSFQDRAGKTHTRDVMMKQEDWDELVFAKTIAVEYLASDPEWNRPITGDAETKFGEGPFLWLMGAMSLVFAFFTVTSFLGYDLKSEDGVTRITRAGRTLKEWGTRRNKTVEVSTGDALVLEEADERDEFGEQTPLLSEAKRRIPLSDAPESAASLRLRSGVAAPVSPLSHKPTGLFALGILTILFGVLGAGLNLLRIALMHNLSVQSIWNAVDALLAILLIVVGAGILGMRLWSRTIGILVASLQILSSIASLVFLIVTSVQAPEAPGEEAMFLTAARIGAGVGVVIGAIFPVVLLVILSKRTTKQAMQRP